MCLEAIIVLPFLFDWGESSSVRIWLSHVPWVIQDYPLLTLSLAKFQDTRNMWSTDNTDIISGSQSAFVTTELEDFGQGSVSFRY